MIFWVVIPAYNVISINQKTYSAANVAYTAMV